MNRIKTTLTRGLAAASFFIAAVGTPASAQGGLETISNPGGGQIVYGPLSQQCTLSVALTTVLRAIHNRFGDQPQLGRLFQAKNSDSVATFFTLTPKGQSAKPITGLVIVSRPAGALPAAAMIYDDTDHFSKSVNAMMKTLNEAWNPNNGSTPSDRLSSRGGASDTLGERRATNPAPTSAAQPLNHTPFPDNTGSIGLPNGWNVGFAGRGGIHASGPNGEAIHLGVMIAGIYDTSNPRAQQQLQYAVRSGRPYIAVPYGGDLVSAYQSISQQNHQRAHTPVPTLTVSSRTPMQPGPSATAAVLVQGDLDNHDGKGPQTFSMIIRSQRPGALGLWTLCVDGVSVPKEIASAEWETMKAIVSSWRQNGDQIRSDTMVKIGEIHKIGEDVDKRIETAHAAEKVHNDAVYKQWDNQDKYSKSFQNYQFDKSQVLDNATNKSGALDYNTAAGLVEGDPNRYQYINPPDFVKGRDY